MILLEKTILHDLIDDMTWSFSRLNSFYKCKRSWYYTYIMKAPSKDNFFSQYGTFVHSIFEKYNKDELEIFELKDYYVENFYNFITESAPPNKYVDLKESYFEKGYNFFSNFNGFNDKTVGAEVSFEINFNFNSINRKIVGFIDRVSVDENGLVVTDYKSKSKFKNKKELKEYARQLYIYSIAVKEKYGKYPYKMIFNQFNEGKEVEIKFNKEDLDETIQWVEETLKNIYEEDTFDMNYNDFFCNWLCSCNDSCENFT